MPIFKIVNPMDVSIWDSKVSVFPEANCFHTSGWLCTLMETYKYRPQYATWWDGAELTGIFPIIEVESIITGKRGVSLPFTDFCPILDEFQGNSQARIEQILDYGKSRGWKYFETRGAKECDAIKNGNSGLSYFVHTLDLTRGANAIYDNLRDSTRRNIGKAEREGVHVFEENTLNGIREFCRLNILSRRDHGLPPQPKQFFDNLFKYVIARGNGKVFLAHYMGKIISGIVCLSLNGNVIYKFGASERQYQRVRPHNLLMWKAISSYSADGNRCFHFGKTETDHDGLLQYKRGWGVDEDGIRYIKYDMKLGCGRVKKPSKTKFYNSVFSRMPLFLLNISGQLLYRHMG